MAQNGRMPRCSKAAGERDGVLFGNADIKGAFRELLCEGVDACSGCHGCRDRNDPVVAFRLFNERICKDLGVARRLGLSPWTVFPTKCRIWKRRDTCRARFRQSCSRRLCA